MKHEVTTFNTKKMLSQSLKKIMNTKLLSKITVTEIVKDCGVNRKTFYYHFLDIQDLLKWTLENEAINIVKNANLINDYTDILNFIIDYIEDNKHIINCVYDTMGREELKRFFCKDFNTIVMKIIETVEIQENIALKRDFKNFLCCFYTEALAGELIELFKNKKPYNRETLIEYLTVTLKYSIPNIVKNYGNEKNHLYGNKTDLHI